VIQPGQQAFFDREVAPHIDGKRVRFVGEVGGSAKRSLFACARGLLMPIRWDEPFGMVMVEALACGTPVIAFPEGAAPELIIDGKTGFLVDDERAMADAIGQLPRIARGIAARGSLNIAMSKSSPPPTSGPTGPWRSPALSGRSRVSERPPTHSCNQHERRREA
jgi:glycosyltransferase involved in cell wall biosynthesis